VKNAVHDNIIYPEDNMQPIKQQAINAISSLPDTATVEDMMYRLYVIDKVNAGLEDMRNGKTISTEELLREIQTW
jgi:predicted transcriptional regulator